MYKFSKYSLGFLALKSLFKAVFQTFIDVGSGAWSQTFLIQVFINCLNSFLVKNKVAKAGARVEVRV